GTHVLPGHAERGNECAWAEIVAEVKAPRDGVMEVGVRREDHDAGLPIRGQREVRIRIVLPRRVGHQREDGLHIVAQSWNEWGSLADDRSRGAIHLPGTP